MSELINNRDKRIETLREVILGLHRGEDPAAVKARVRKLVGSATAAEIAAMEQRLIEEGMSPEEIKGLCDLHKDVVQEVITPQPLTRRVPPGHPVDVFREENRALSEAATTLRRALSESDDRGSWREALERVLEVDKHYARKEHLLFPKLEDKGVSGPSQVMWAKDDEVRDMGRALREALASDESEDAEGWRKVVATVGLPLVEQVEAMIDREEQILFPMALEKLTEEDWAAVHVESPRFGFCLVEPRGDWAPSPSAQAAGAAAEVGGSAEALAEGRVRVGCGSLSLKQLRSMLGVLPIDLTLVDDQDRVVFFSEGERIFDRTPAVIGRRVQLCHPPKSVDTVERILADFRAGDQDVAEFWIQLHGRFVHIRYFALRDDEERYLGTLEVTQDLTALRALEGERRLLSYDAPSA
jgi:hypothetical protein